LPAASGCALVSLAIAVSAAWGGFASGAVAALAATVLVRATSTIALAPAFVVAAEGLVLAAIVARLAASIEDRSRRLASAEARIRELQESERHLRAVDAAFDGFERISDDCAAVILDYRGRIAEWRSGPVRVVGWPAGRRGGRAPGAPCSPPTGPPTPS